MVVEGAMLVVGTALITAETVHKSSRRVVTCREDVGAET